MLEEGKSVAEAGLELATLPDTARKAIQACHLHRPGKKDFVLQASAGQQQKRAEPDRRIDRQAAQWAMGHLHAAADRVAGGIIAGATEAAAFPDLQHVRTVGATCAENAAAAGSAGGTHRPMEGGLATAASRYMREAFRAVIDKFSGFPEPILTGQGGTMS